MMKEISNKQKEPSQLVPIEELKVEFGISEAVFAGVKLANKWAEGKEVTKEEFESAVKKWLKAPVDGRGVK